MLESFDESVIILLFVVYNIKILICLKYNLQSLFKLCQHFIK